MVETICGNHFENHFDQKVTSRLVSLVNQVRVHESIQITTSLHCSCLSQQSESVPRFDPFSRLKYPLPMPDAGCDVREPQKPAAPPSRKSISFARVLEGAGQCWAARESVGECWRVQGSAVECCRVHI